MADSALNIRQYAGREYDQDRVREAFLREAFLRGLPMRRARPVADFMTQCWRSKRKGAGEAAKKFLLIGGGGLKSKRTNSGDSGTPPPPPPPPPGDVIYGEGLPSGYVPTAPLQRVDVTPKVWNGTTRFVPSGNNTALFAAYAAYDPAAGDRIVLEAGGLWTFSANTIIGAKSFADFQQALMEPEDWEDIAAALGLAADGMPAGMPRVHGDGWTGPNTRMTEAAALALGIPRIVCTGSGSSLAFGPNSGGLYVRGIWFDNALPNGQCSGTINVGHYAQANGYNSPDDMPSDVTLNQVIQGHNNDEQVQKGVRFCGARLAIVNSTMWGMSKFFSDANGWWGAGGRGPWKVTNNMIAGVGENAFIGGNQLQEYHRDVLPADIEMNYNWYHKPSRYLHSHPDFIPPSVPSPFIEYHETFVVKNTLESKYGLRWENIGCVHDGCVSGSQAGQGGQGFSPKCSGQGSATFDWVECSDVLFWLNKTINVGAGYILYRDQRVGGVLGRGSKRMMVENNLCLLGAPEAYTGSRTAVQFAGDIGSSPEPDNWSFRRNTFGAVDGEYDLHGNWVNQQHMGTSVFYIEDNVFALGNNRETLRGWWGSGGVGEGKSTLDLEIPLGLFRGNVVTGRDPAKYAGYTADNYFPASNAAAGFDPVTGVITPGGPLDAGGIYDAHDGRANGADVARINSVTSGVMTAAL